MDVNESGQMMNGYQVKSVVWEGFTIETLKSPKAPEGAEFLPSRVTLEGIEWWSFKRDHPDFKGLALLREVNGEFVIALATRKGLHQVLPMKDITKLVKTNDGDFIGGRPIKELITLKEATARELGLDPLWTPREAAMRNAIRRDLTEKRIAERQAVEEKRAKARAEREERKTKIMSRKRLYVFTSDGKRRNGIPIVDDEWRLLPIDTFCISVDSFDEDTGAIGAVLESFVVGRRKDNVYRAAVVSVSLERPHQHPVRLTLPQISPRVIKINGEYHEVFEFPNMEEVKKVHEQVRDSGTLVMVPKSDAKDRFTVFRLETGGIKTVTELQRAV